VDKQKFCIVDIETTGGRGKNHKVTEIAMVKFDGDEVIDQFSSLVNPERKIPYNITALTGINNEMVSCAPKFFEIAKTVIEFLGEDIFVAHNVFFDFNILKSEFSELGFSFKADKLCTVKMARKFIPGHKSYSLGRVCQDLGIEITNRHRALGDALATTELLKLILKATTRDILIANLSASAKLLLPDHLERDEVESLPQGCGLYYFLDEQGHIIYVGKSINIQTRVKSHFRPDLKREKDILLKKSIHSIETYEVGNEWVSLIVEACEIKKHRPQFNRALNRVNFRFALELVAGNESVKSELKVVSATNGINQAYWYRSRKVAGKALLKFYDLAFGCNPDKLAWKAFKKGLGNSDFNSRLGKIYEAQNYPEPDFVLKVSADKKIFIKMTFAQDALERIEWLDDGELVKSYKVDEDPDIKRITLKKLRHFYCR
jgi:DNA polymerase III epsilon subunit family exonuclease